MAVAQTVTDQPMAKSNTLRVRIGTSATDVDPRTAALTIESLDTFGRVFRSTNLELLEAIVEDQPGSIRELARTVDRHPPAVHKHVTELAEHGVVELVDDGRAKRPTVWYDELRIDVPLGDLSVDAASD